MSKDYSALHQTYEYVEDKAELLAEAMNEVLEIESRKQYLLDLLKTNSKLKKFLWQTADGKVIAMHKIETEHLVNILNHLHENGREISGPLKAEARKRNIALPDTPRLFGPNNSAFAW